MNFFIRELIKEDLDSSKDFFETFDNLRSPGEISISNAEAILDTINSNDGHIYVAIDKDTEKIIGTATIIIEQKFIRQGGKVGRIEDVSTKKGYEKQSVGRTLIKYIIEFAKKAGCYKVTLECSNDHLKFYENFGLKKHANFMRLDF